ncbi:hypothetical protein ACA910_007437 [Epithemia clementina (nom. ined.)]
MLTTTTRLNFLAVIFIKAICLFTASSRYLRTDNGVSANGGNPAVALVSPQNGAKIREELDEESFCIFYEQHAAVDANAAADNNTSPKDSTICTCELDNGSTFVLELPSDSPSCDELMKKNTLKSAVSRLQMKQGAYIDHKKQKIILSKGQPLGVDNCRGRPSDVFQQGKHSRSLAGNAIGSRTFLVVKIVAKDPNKGGASTFISQTEAQLSDRVFGTSGDLVNLKTQYEACSQGLYTVTPATVGNPKTDQYYIQNGVVTVEVDTNVTQGRLANSNAAINKLKQMFNLGSQSPQNILANHFLFCMPPGTTTDGGSTKHMSIAMASTGGWQSWFRGDWCTYPSAQMHEIGHNYFLGHAAEGTAPYGDTAGAMGTSIGQHDSPKFCFNAAQRYDLGWYHPSGLVKVTSPPTGVLDINIIGFVQPFASGTTLIKIVNPLYTGTAYTNNMYLHLNAQKGPNAGTQEGGNKVTVVEKVESSAQGAATKLIGKLDASTAPVQIAGFFSENCVLTISVTRMQISTNTSAATVRVRNVCV